jgi:hypothetical protein
MVGEEAPHGLMRNGGEPPIHGGLRPDHRGEIRATRNLAEKKRQVKGVEGRCTRERRGKRSEELRNKTQSE